MKGRRGAREAAVQFLYACDLAGVTPQELSEDFWALREERERQRIRRTQARAVVGFLEAIKARRNHFEKHQAALDEQLPAVDEENRLGGHLAALSHAYGQLRESLERIEADLAHPGDAPQVLLPESLELCRECLKVLIRQHDQWDEAVAARPAASKIVEPIAGRLSKLRDHEEHLAAILEPALHPEHHGAKQVLDRIAELSKVREVPEQWTFRTFERIEEIDAILEKASDNFHVERLQSVDRAILRLATLEILDGDVPPAVAINEALEIAKRFSSTESSSFLNGVLEQVRKNNDPDSKI